jgi:hypothetical protein
MREVAWPSSIYRKKQALIKGWNKKDFQNDRDFHHNSFTNFYRGYLKEFYF